LLVVAAVALVVALAVADALRSGRSSSRADTTPLTTTEPAPSLSTEEEFFLPSGLSPRQEIKRIGNRWAQLFALRRQGSCFYMTQPVCERIDCVRAGGFRIKNCEPLTWTFRRSFEGATVEDIVMKNDWRAAATFSNGQVVEFMGDGGTWWIRRLGEDVSRKFFE
jgi:hypothetical protein